MTARLSVLGFALLAFAGCRSVRPSDVPVSGPASVPTTILISLDGFRWDYLQRPEAVRLRELAARGVRAERLIPSFPTKTFPNHITLATGLYPEHHGIAANVMLDAVLGRFRTGGDPAARDARWYNGEPIWVTAERQGVRTASFFWPGSEAPIGGFLPHWTLTFDPKATRASRVEQTMSWLQLPADSAPRLIALYFPDVDTKGHDFGPDAPETRAAIADVDSAVGAVIDGVARLGRTDRVNIVVVSDHGMTEITAERSIALDEYVSMDSLDVGDWDPVATLIPRGTAGDYVFRALEHAHPHLKVYRKADVPARLHYSTGARITPIVAIADEGWSIGTRERISKVPRGRTFGAHGYDNALPSMGATFIAAGPDIRRGVTVPPFANVHIYPLLAQLLRVTPVTTDGSLDSVRVVLRQPR